VGFVRVAPAHAAGVMVEGFRTWRRGAHAETSVMTAGEACIMSRLLSSMCWAIVPRNGRLLSAAPNRPKATHIGPSIYRNVPELRLLEMTRRENRRGGFYFG
jgi:hypothetical protein